MARRGRRREQPDRHDLGLAQGPRRRTDGSAVHRNGPAARLSLRGRLPCRPPSPARPRRARRHAEPALSPPGHWSWPPWSPPCALAWLWMRSTPAATAVSVRSMAVLPFRSLTNDGEYLGLGMADALITRLGSTKRLLVRSTGAVQKYAVPDLDPVAAGREPAGRLRPRGKHPDGRRAPAHDGAPPAGHGWSHVVGRHLRRAADRYLLGPGLASRSGLRRRWRWS